MGRPRCDPIDVAGVLDALACGRTTPFQAYREYASTAARPYARASWEGILKQARQSGQDCPHGVLAVTPLRQAQRELDPASLDAASDAYWEQFLRIKSRILTTVADNASLRVKGARSSYATRSRHHKNPAARSNRPRHRLRRYASATSCREGRTRSRTDPRSSCSDYRKLRNPAR